MLMLSLRPYAMQAAAGLTRSRLLSPQQSLDGHAGAAASVELLCSIGWILDPRPLLALGMRTASSTRLPEAPTNRSPQVTRDYRNLSTLKKTVQSSLP